LITENFKINSGNSATKRKQEEALSNNYRVKVHPHTLDFNRQSPLSSPICTPSKRRVLGEIQNSPLFRPKDSPTIERLKNTPISKQNSPLIDSLSPLTSRSERKRTKISRISRIFEERTKYKMSNKENEFLNMSETFLEMDSRENESLMMFSRMGRAEHQSLVRPDIFKMNKRESESLKMSDMFNKMANSENESLNMSETFVKLDVEEETRDCSFGATFPASSATMPNWCTAKLDFTDAIQSKIFETENEEKNLDMYVPEKEATVDTDFETLHDLEEEFDCNNFDECSKYEIISTDSPNIISSGRSTSRKVHSRNFDFGAPLLENENSTSFNKPNVTATRMLNFEDESFEFTSPALKHHSASVKKSLKFTEKHNASVKKSLKFSETPTKNVLRHEKSDSSIGSMSMSPASTKLRLYPSESTMSMESGFISELEDQFLDYEISNSPKIANFNELLSGRIKDSFTDSKLLSGDRGGTFGDCQLLSSPMKDVEERFDVRRQIKDGFPEQSFNLSFNNSQLSSQTEHNAAEKQLLSGKILDSFEKPFSVRRPLQRSLSFNPEVSKARVSLFSINESPNQEKKNKKRNERSEMENISSKRRRSNCQSPEMEKPVRPVLQRAFSENHASIMSAMTRFESEPGLIGDFTQPFALPLTSGDHTDLNSISCDTLAGLLRGDYAESISEFQVIDCRYPYEFEGGHIAGAVNLYTPELVQALVEEPASPGQDGRRILVFHCEFSRERGPKLSRFLRSKDRAKNKENYPSLHYPEVYLLHSGYRAFYQRYPELCSPTGYTAMLDPSHRVALKKHRSFSQPASTQRRHRLLL
ncbi:jg15533, partial [Pararge aegeria aegeria]